MLATWILFSLAVSLLVALSARAAEGALAEVGVPTRWSWFGGIGLSVVLSVLPLLPSFPSLGAILQRLGLMGGTGAGAEMGPLVVGGGMTIPATIPVGPGSALGGLDPLAGALWLSGAMLLLGYVGVRLLRLGRMRRAWVPITLPEGRVLISRSTGPAVCGIFRAEIVIPRWCLKLPGVQRSLILEHENEHRRARDSLLVASTGMAALALPWNLPLWWMWRRLRDAVEVDCDARVTRRRPGMRREYGDLLLMVGSRRSGFSPLAAFSQRTSTLSRRIHMLTRPESPLAFPRALLFGSVAVGLLATACLVPGPDEPESTTGPDSLTEVLPTELDAPDPSISPLADAPQFTPHDTRPRILNPDEVDRALKAAYPEDLRNAGIGGTTTLYMFVDQTGTVRNAQLAESSGHEGFDAAALSVAEAFTFSPAESQDDAVPVWIQVPVVFTEASTEADDSGNELAETLPENLPEAVADRSPASDSGPVFTPHDVRPRILNQDEVMNALREAYPAELRDNGIGGTTMVHFFVNAEGVVQNMVIAESSGHEALDTAALDVARSFEFSPAENRGEAVPVWIQVPVSFHPR